MQLPNPIPGVTNSSGQLRADRQAGFREADIVVRSGRDMVLRSAAPVAPETLVRIEFQDGTLIGRIDSCRPDVSGYLVLAEIVHAIPSLSDLGRLVLAVIQEHNSPAAVVIPAPDNVV